MKTKDLIKEIQKKWIYVIERSMIRKQEEESQMKQVAEELHNDYLTDS